MPISTSLRPGIRAFLVAVTLSGGALALPAAAATTTAVAPAASAPTAITQAAIAPTAIVDVAPLDRAAADRMARIEHRRELRQHRREVRERRRQRRLHRHQVLTRKALRAFHIGLDQKGDPYVWGATGPNAFDCSGLTSYAYHRAGLSLPRTAAAQSGAVRHIRHAQMRRGDLMFFSDGGHVYHVGLFAGRRHGTDYILQAPRPGEDVQVVPTWTGSWFGGTPR